MRRPTVNRHGRLALGLIAVLAAFPVARAEDPAPPPRSTSTVGMPAKLKELVLPGTELEAKPIEDRRTPMVVRVVAAYAHGSAFRYDIIYYGLEPGRYDLKDYMRRKDGTTMGNVPSIPVSVQAILPPGQVEPHGLILGASPWLGGYRLLILVGGLAWLAVLAALALAGRRKRRNEVDPMVSRSTLADRLRPLVVVASTGQLDAGRRAELERLLIGYWRRRLGFEELPPARVIAALRENPEAGPLFHRLEDWLHRPAGSTGPVDVAALLAPYRSIPAEDENEVGDGPSSKSGPAPARSRSEVRA